jgi:hypothetical protein
MTAAHEARVFVGMGLGAAMVPSALTLGGS